MPFRVLSDGSIETDTVDEALALRDRILGKAQLESRIVEQPPLHSGAGGLTQPSTQSANLVAEPTDDSAPVRTWQREDVIRLMEHSKLRDTVRIAVSLGSGATSTEYARALGTKPNGVGVRMRYVTRITDEIDEKLSPPVFLSGEAGDRHIMVRKDFADVFKQAFLAAPPPPKETEA